MTELQDTPLTSAKYHISRGSASLGLAKQPGCNV